MADKKKKSTDITSLIREAGTKAKQAIEFKESGGVSTLPGNFDEVVVATDGTRQPFKPRIFDIIDYIEKDWGLGMKLYPVQKAIVKLYYFLPLEDKIKTIRITDMLGEQEKYHFTEAEYIKYLYEEGRCNIGELDHPRQELVLSIGRRGGKCLRDDSLILTNQGMFRIEDLSQAEEENFSEFRTIVAQESGRKAESVAFYNGGIKPTFEIVTQSGYRLVGTGNHRIKVLAESGKIEWRYLDEMKAGDLAAINRTTDLWPQSELNVQAYHNDSGYKDVKLPDELNTEWGLLLGYLVGDGTWGDGHSTAFTVEHSETWTKLTELLQQLVGEPRRQMDARTEQTGRLEFCSVRLRRFLHDIGFELGTTRDQKMVPWAILQSPKSVVCAFLRGLFETDGCAEDSGRKITLSSVSFKLAREVQLLLLNLGIVSSVRRKWDQKTKRHYANLTIKGHRSRERFVTLIGFDSDKKRLPTERYLNASASEGKSDTDSVPYQYSHVRSLLDSVPKNKSGTGWARSKLREVLGNTCKPKSGEDLTYSRMRRTVEVAKELNADPALISHFEYLLEADYFFDPIESCSTREDQVYDLTVPDGESFVADGFTNHNTTLSSIFASYEVYRLLNLHNPQAYYGFPNGNRIQLISVAVDKDQASILFNEVTTHLAKCEYFKPYILNNTLSHIQFRTPYDIDRFGPSDKQANGKFVSFNGKASLRVTFKSSIAKGLRGPSNAVVIMDEMAHYNDTGKSSADTVYAAVTPSTATYAPKDPATGMPFKRKDGSFYPVESRIISISSPLNRSGKFYELFNLAMTKGPGSQNMIAVQAPTWEVNPTVPPDYYKQRYHSDPASFMVEHGAEFSDRTKSWIERKEDLMACVDPNLRPLLSGITRQPFQCGIDIGLTNDATALTLTTISGNHIVMAYHELWQAGVDWRESNPHLGVNYSTEYCKRIKDEKRLDFEEIANWIDKLTHRFHITDGIFDRFYGITLDQALKKRGHNQFRCENFSRQSDSQMFQTTKLLMFDKVLRLYDYPIIGEGKKNSAPIEELLTLQSKMLTKNVIVVEAPDGAGFHDDFSDSLVRAVWLSSERMLNGKFAFSGRSVLGPNGVNRMSVKRYQMSRARKHGGLYTERVAPRIRKFGR